MASIQEKLEEIYKKVIDLRDGEVADYIPALANVNEDLFGLSACTVHGNLHSFGDHKVEFGLQSASKPLTYCVACDMYGSEKVHQHVGYEPSGQSFNSHTLNDSGLPHNPFINAGAIMVAKLLSDHAKEASHKLELIRSYFCKMAGGIGKVGYDPVVFLSEKEHADRNVSLTYYMREKGAFGSEKPSHSEITEALELYYSCCTFTINTDMGAVIAATLANGGVCPMTGEQVFKKETVTNCLTLMFSCGMYNYSGQFIFEVGLPAKSGVSGIVLLVVPNQMGICSYSPRLDSNGNSVRGLEVCKMVSNKFQVHLFRNQVLSCETQLSEVIANGSLETQGHDQTYYITRLITAASSGDLTTCKELIPKVEDINKGDYDRRTALHLASAEGHLEIVKLLVENGADPECKDRWGATAVSEAQNNEHQTVSDFFSSQIN